MQLVLRQAKQAITESVRRDGALTVPDWPRLLATLEGIGVQNCPTDFVWAWDDLLSSFQKHYEATRTPDDRTFEQAAARALLGDLTGAALQLIGPQPKKADGTAEVDRAFRQLKRVVERHESAQEKSDGK